MRADGFEGASTLTEKTDVAVVGGGFAGLSAGLRLLRAGRSFVVLEASDRIGGRAWTDYGLLEGVPLELGAQMIHGRTAVTHGWLVREGLQRRRLPVQQRSRIVIDRRAGAFPWVALPFHPVVGTRALYDGLVRIPNEIDAATSPDRTLAAFLDEHPRHPAARRIVELLYAHVSAADPDAIGLLGPAEEYRAAREPYGFRNFQLREGYGALVDRVAARLGTRIRRQQAVTDLVLEPNGVRITTRDPDGRPSELSAQAAIVTVSLGVLKSGTLRFDPPLPAAKQEAILRIAFGDAYAVQLRVRGGTLTDRLGDFALLYGGTPTSLYRPRVGLRERERVVTGFAVGREARRRVALSDLALVDATLLEWETMLPPGVSVGQVEGMRVHRWTTDPWVRGGYSYLPPGVGLAARRELAAPVGGRLFFAGEATDWHGQSGTVAGAIDTGTRAAEELLGAASGWTP